MGVDLACYKCNRFEGIITRRGHDQRIFEIDGNLILPGQDVGRH